MKRLTRWLGVCLLVLLAAPAVALASSAVNAPTLVLPWQQVWPLVIGGLVPLVTYVLNRAGPWVSQPVKAFVLVIVSAIATALYVAFATNVIGFNTATLQLILTGVGASFAAHHWLWKPAGVSTLLGAYAQPHTTVRSRPPGAPTTTSVPPPAGSTAPPAV